MMLVVKRKGTGGLGRYRKGSGIFGKLSGKLVSSGFKKVISSAASSALAHKVTDAVVKGATSATEKASEDIARGLYTALKDKVVGQKRPLPLEDSTLELRKKINKVFDGTGIVFD